ncbi:MAG: DNA topoisomerase [Lachnospiraceae bacterium]|nr:DNA topoisomerase [Lachnospiraceae bacterium]
MLKKLYIAEKPSVAREFARVMNFRTKNNDGYIESEEAIFTWCVGHLVTMSYPDAYDAIYKRWSLETIPFLPAEFKYEVIENVKKQFNIVKLLLNRDDVGTIYVCTDSGREGEYIYRLVESQSGIDKNNNYRDKKRRRVWIDSQTEDEIKRGISEAKDLKDYDNLSAAAYLRAKEDYLMGINFSRALTLKYSSTIKSYLKADKAVISVGRVMTCVLGMVVRREREIRAFVKTPFYRVLAQTEIGGKNIEAEWKAAEGSRYFGSPLLYKENGFKTEEAATELIDFLKEDPNEVILTAVEKKKEQKNAPLLYNLAELQNDCAKFFKISPDETLRIAQELYEKKLVTYPRTDARVLSSAVGKEIEKNLNGLTGYQLFSDFAKEILAGGSYKKINNTRYVNDKQITDHYAIIPTGQGLRALESLNPVALKIYEIITRRFLSIFYPAAVYQKISLVFTQKTESFFANFKILVTEGYLKVFAHSYSGKGKNKSRGESEDESENEGESKEQESYDLAFFETLTALKPGQAVCVNGFEIKEGETTPPKRYNSGTLILAMENAGQFIEDEELRAQIKGSGIGTSATRAEILKKLVTIKYLNLNKKTQIITPALLGEMIYDVVNNSIRALLDPALTASWEKGLEMVARGTITEAEYMIKLNDFISRRTNQVKEAQNMKTMYRFYEEAAANYGAKGKG